MTLRKTLGAVALLCVLVVQTLNTMHSLTAIHRLCAEHGTVIDESLAVGAAENDRLANEFSFERLDPPPHHGSRDHCAFVAVSGSKAQQELRASLSHLPPPAAMRCMPAAINFSARADELLLLAPKHSPPQS
jgi:hypothetical protein